MKRIISIIGLSAFLLASPSQPALADAEVVSANREQPKDTRGPHCSFSRAEKIGMMLWIVPLAGAIYTPFACKREVFGSEASDVERTVAYSKPQTQT